MIIISAAKWLLRPRSAPFFRRGLAMGQTFNTTTQQRLHAITRHHAVAGTLRATSSLRIGGCVSWALVRFAVRLAVRFHVRWHQCINIRQLDARADRHPLGVGREQGESVGRHDTVGAARCCLMAGLRCTWAAARCRACARCATLIGTLSTPASSHTACHSRLAWKRRMCWSC